MTTFCVFDSEKCCQRAERDMIECLKRIFSWVSPAAEFYKVGTKLHTWMMKSEKILRRTYRAIAESGVLITFELEIS